MSRRALEWADEGRAILRAERDPRVAKELRAHALSVAAEAEAYVEPITVVVEPPRVPARRLAPAEMAKRLGISVRTLSRRRAEYSEFLVFEGRGYMGDSERFEAFLRRR